MENQDPRNAPPGIGQRPRVDRSGWPKTIAGAVNVLLTKLSEGDLQTIRGLERPQDMTRFHFSLGLWIRNNFGLWQGNEALLTECCGDWFKEPDHASGVIMEALWKRLHEQEHQP